MRSVGLGGVSPPTSLVLTYAAAWFNRLNYLVPGLVC